MTMAFGFRLHVFEYFFGWAFFTVFNWRVNTTIAIEASSAFRIEKKV